MRAYFGDPTVKEFYLARVRAHALADEIVQGVYWDQGRGCGIGCTVHDADHDRYESELGIPCDLARLEDRIFEALPLGAARRFPAQFLAAITPGADLSRVGRWMAVWFLGDPFCGAIAGLSPASAALIHPLIRCYIAWCANGVVPEGDWLRHEAILEAASLQHPEHEGLRLGWIAAAMGRWSAQGNSERTFALLFPVATTEWRTVPGDPRTFAEHARDHLLGLLRHAPVPDERATAPTVGHVVTVASPGRVPVGARART